MNTPGTSPKAPIISIIIPIYNCDPYLDNLVSTLQQQTLNNWVAICVNDGSRDRSLDILQKWAKKEPRLKIVNKPNGGAASARNKGLEIAQTEYITFLDADDDIPTDALKRLVEAAESTQCDMVVASHTTYTDDDQTIFVQAEASGYMPAIPRFFFRNIFRSPFGKLYRKSIIDKYKLRMPEDMPMAEDYVFVVSYWTRCRTVYSILDSLYNYRYGDNQNSLIHRFCRKELPFEVYRLNAEAPWRVFCFLKSAEKDRSVISAWTYELFRDLWKMAINSCRYLDSEDEKQLVMKEVCQRDKAMRPFIPLLKYYCMHHRYPSLLPYVEKLKKILRKSS